MTLQQKSINLFRFEYVIFLFFSGLLFGITINPYLTTNLGLLSILLAAVHAISRYRLVISKNSLNSLYGIFILYEGLHLLIAIQFITLIEAYRVVITIFSYVGIYVIIQSYTTSFRNIVRLNFIFALLVLSESVLSILQHYSGNFYITSTNVGDVTTRIVKGYDIFSHFSLRMAIDFNEARGTFGQKNQLGAFLLLLTPYFISISFAQLKKNYSINSIFYCVVSLAALVALYFSYSRASWLGLVVSLFVIFLYTVTGRMKLIIAFVFFGCIVLILNNNVIQIVYNYFYSTDATLYQRLPFWLVTIDHINATPYSFFFGYSFISPYILDSFYNQYSWTPAGHNSYLTLFEAKGLFGLAIVLALLFTAIHKLMAILKSSLNYELRSMALGFLSGLTGFMVSQIFDHKLFLYSIEINIFLIVIIALTVSFSRHMKQQ